MFKHLADPASQIEIFNEIMDRNSIALFNWYFYKGEKMNIHFTLMIISCRKFLKHFN